jgi:hypothetical protein
MKRKRYDVMMQIPEIAANSSPAHLPAFGSHGQ